jgi:zinc transport system permease protein
VSPFLDALASQAFLRNALLAALLASIGCGVVGTYVVARRIGYLAGGIAHTVLGGMGVAYFLGAHPLAGALIAAVAAALVIGLVTLRWRQQEDVVIGALWAIGMAVGILFISRTPGYNADLMSYLFGNVLMVSNQDLGLMAGLDALVILVAALFHKQLTALCFDEEFARVRGVPVVAFHLLLLCVVAVAVVALVQVVGLILVIALLTLPAAIAGQFVRSIGAMMLLACAAGAVFATGGLAASFAADVPSGASIILLAGLGYLASLLLARLVSRRRA